MRPAPYASDVSMTSKPMSIARRSTISASVSSTFPYASPESPHVPIASSDTTSPVFPRGLLRMEVSLSALDDQAEGSVRGWTMIRRASVIAIGLVLFACGGDEAKPAPVAPTSTPPPPPPPATVEAPKEDPKPKETLGQLQEKAGRAMIDALNAHDAKKLASLYTESAVVKIA